MYLLSAHDETGLYINVYVEEILVVYQRELRQMWASRKEHLLKTGWTSLF